LFSVLLQLGEPGRKHLSRWNVIAKRDFVWLFTTHETWFKFQFTFGLPGHRQRLSAN